MLERTWVRSGLLKILGIECRFDRELLTLEQERLLIIGFLVGVMSGKSVEKRESWIIGKAGRVFLGFPDGLTHEECEAIFTFFVDTRGSYEI